MFKLHWHKFTPSPLVCCNFPPFVHFCLNSASSVTLQVDILWFLLHLLLLQLMSVALSLKTLMCKSTLTVTDVRCVLSDVVVLSSSQLTSGTSGAYRLLTRKLVTSFILHSPAAMTIAKCLLEQVRLQYFWKQVLL